MKEIRCEELYNLFMIENKEDLDSLYKTYHPRYSPEYPGEYPCLVHFQFQDGGDYRDYYEETFIFVDEVRDMLKALEESKK